MPLDQTLAAFPTGRLGGRQRQALAATISDWKRFWAADSQVWQLYAKGGLANLRAADNLANGAELTIYNDLLAQTRTLTSTAQAHEASAAADARSAGSTVRLVTIAIACVALVIALAFALLVTRRTRT